MLSEPIQVTLKVITAFDRLGIPYLIGGSLASAVRGETSERQWRDIMGVLDLQGDRLDFKYLQTWATELGILDLLQRAIQAGQGKEKDT